MVGALQQAWLISSGQRGQASQAYIDVASHLYRQLLHSYLSSDYTLGVAGWFLMLNRTLGAFPTLPKGCLSLHLSHTILVRLVSPSIKFGRISVD